MDPDCTSDRASSKATRDRVHSENISNQMGSEDISDRLDDEGSSSEVNTTERELMCQESQDWFNSQKPRRRQRTDM